MYSTKKSIYHFFLYKIWEAKAFNHVCTGKLSREVESQSEEQSTYLAYDKRVKELAQELTVTQVKRQPRAVILL